MSCGVVKRCQSYRSDARERGRLENIFMDPEITFFHIQVKFREVQLFKIGTPELQESCLPFNMKEYLEYAHLIAPSFKQLSNMLDNKTRIVSIQPRWRSDLRQNALQCCPHAQDHYPNPFCFSLTCSLWIFSDVMSFHLT